MPAQPFARLLALARFAPAPPVLALLALLAGAAGSPAQAAADEAVQRPDSIVAASLTGPTQRYRHFVLGRDFELSSLEVRLADGRALKLTLPESEVFEDREARIVDLDQDGRNEVVVVRSSTRTGSSLVVIGARGGALQIIAQGPATGGPQRWLNPAGIADFDGDGRLDIAYVQQPHVLGLLRAFAFTGDGLAEIASLPDAANHVAGSTQTHLSVVADFDGDGIADLAVPSRDRKTLRFITFKGGAREIAAKRLPAPAVSNFKLVKTKDGPAVDVGLSGGGHVTLAP